MSYVGLTNSSVWHSYVGLISNGWLNKLFVWLIARLYARIAATPYSLTHPWWRNGIDTLYIFLVLCPENPPVIGGHPWQRVNNAHLSGSLRCQAAQDQLNIALRSQVWVNPFGFDQMVVQLYFRRSLICCDWQWLASSGEQPLSTSSLTDIRFVDIRLPFFTVES